MDIYINLCSKVRLITEKKKKLKSERLSGLVQMFVFESPQSIEKSQASKDDSVFLVHNTPQVHRICGSLYVTGPPDLTGIGAVRCGFAAVGLALLEEAYICGHRL